MAEIKTINDICQSTSEVPKRITKSGTIDAELNSSGEIIKTGVIGTPSIFKTIESPQRFLGKSGLEDIDLNLEDCTGKYFEFEYMSENNLIKSAFNDNTDDTPLASFIIKADDINKEKWINYKPYNCESVMGVASTNTITYENVYNNVDIQYKNQINDIKQYITLKDSTAQTVFDFTITHSDDIELVVEELPILSIQYNGASAEGTIEVTSENHIIGRTQSTTSFDLDLTSEDYDTLQEVVDYIDNLSTWSASIISGCGTCRSKTLSVISATDCKTSEITLNSELKSIKAVNPDMPNSRSFWEVKRPFANSNRTGSETSMGFIELIPSNEHENGVYDVIRITIDSSWVSSEFSSGATEIVIDPTTYTIIRDYGNITFCGDYASGNQHGTNGFMNGYGRITRGTEAVQSGGTRVENDNALITYIDPDGTEYAGGAATKGVWTYLSNGSFSGSSVHYIGGSLNCFGAKVKTTFTGTEIWLGAYIGTDEAIKDVYIDGRYYGTLDTYNATSEFQQKILLATGLENTSHIVELIRTAQKNINATSSYDRFDYFEYYTAGNELSNKGAITINGISTYGLDCTYAKHPNGIQYHIQGNLANDTGGDPAKGSFSCWIKLNFDYDADANDHRIWTWYTLGPVTDKIKLYYDGSDDKFHFAIYNGADWTTCHVESASQNFTSGDIICLSCTWDETIGVSLFVNNIKTSDSSTWVATDLSGILILGNGGSLGVQANMILAEPTIFDYVLTDNEVYDIYSSAIPIWEMDFGRRVEVLNRTNKGMLFNYSGVIDPGNRIGSFAGKLYKTSATSGTAIAEADVSFVGTWTDSGNYRYTTDNTAYMLDTTPTCTEIWACFYAGTTRGIAEYIIDEGTSKEKHILIDQYHSGSEDRYALIATGLENKTHTIKAKMKDLKNISSTAKGIYIGINGSADKMYYYVTSGSENITTNSLTVNNRLIDNVLKCEDSTLPNLIQFPSKGNISSYDHEGSVEILCRTPWAGNDSAHHYFLHTKSKTDGLNGLHFAKTNINQFDIAYYPGSYSPINVTATANSTNWSADTIHHVLIKWWRPTSSTMGMSIYIDGVKLAENKSQSFIPTFHSEITIGGIYGLSYGINGEILDLSIHNHAFNDGGVPVGSYVDPISEVGQSYRGYSRKYLEDLSSQVGAGATTTFKLSKGLLQGLGPDNENWIWPKSYKNIDISANTQRSYVMIYDETYDRFISVGDHNNGSNYDAVLWYSQTNNIDNTTWTRVNIDNSAGDQRAYGIMYDSGNSRYYVVGSSGGNQTTLWYSSSNNLASATWTSVNVDSSVTAPTGSSILYDSIHSIYYIFGYYDAGAGNNNPVVWYSSSNNLTSATWTRVTIDSSANPQAAFDSIYDSINSIYYVVGYEYVTAQYDAVLWYSSSNDLTSATWTKVNLDAIGGNQFSYGIVYDSINSRYYVSDTDGTNIKILISSSNDLASATWTKLTIDSTASTAYAHKICYDSINLKYYISGYQTGSTVDAVFWTFNVANHLGTPIDNIEFYVDSDSTSSNVISIKEGTFCRTNGAISAIDTTIQVDSFTNSESEIDPNGGYLHIGQANSLWRKQVEYSSYDSTSNIFVIADSGVVGEAFVDNTIIEVCGTISVDSAPAEGSIVKTTYYYSGDSVDREYGLIPDRLNKNLWLDVTGNANTGWYMVGSSGYSGFYGIYTYTKGSVNIINSDNSSLALNILSNTNSGISQIILNQGTNIEKTILLDEYGTSTYQTIKSISVGLTKNNIIRLITAVDKNASSSGYGTDHNSFLTSSQSDLTGNALLANDVNCVFNFSAIRVVNGQLDYDKDKSGNLVLDGAINSTIQVINIKTDTAADLNRLGRPNGIIKLENEFIYYNDIEFTSATTAILSNCKRGYLNELIGAIADSHIDETSIQLVGAWRNNIIARATSWFAESGAFPYRALLVGCGTEGNVEGGLVIRDLDNNSNYMVFEAGDTNIARGAIKATSGHTGKIEIGYGTLNKGYSDIDFISDEILGPGVGYGSAAGTKGTIAQRNSGLGWSYTTHTGVSINSNYVNSIITNFDSTNYNVWLSSGKSGTTGSSAGINRIYDSGSDGLLNTEYDLDSDSSYWATRLCYDITNDDLYVAQTNGSANQDIWSKIGTPKISSDSTIDTADGSDRLTSQAICNDIALEVNNVWFATDSGAKSVVKADFSSGVTNTLDHNDFSSELSIDVCKTINYDPDNAKFLLGFNNLSDGLLIECYVNGSSPIYYDKTSGSDVDRLNVLSDNLITAVCYLYRDNRELGDQYTEIGDNGWVVATNNGITIKESEGVSYSLYSDPDITESNGVYTIAITGTPRREMTFSQSNGVYTRTIDDSPYSSPMVDKIISESNGVYTSSDQS